jgi:hypothetical protein
VVLGRLGEKHSAWSPYEQALYMLLSVIQWVYFDPRAVPVDPALSALSASLRSPQKKKKAQSNKKNALLKKEEEKLWRDQAASLMEGKVKQLSALMRLGLLADGKVPIAAVEGKKGRGGLSVTPDGLQAALTSNAEPAGLVVDPLARGSEQATASAVTQHFLVTGELALLSGQLAHSNVKQCVHWDTFLVVATLKRTIEHKMFSRVAATEGAALVEEVLARLREGTFFNKMRKGMTAQSFTTHTHSFLAMLTQYSRAMSSHPHVRTSIVATAKWVRKHIEKYSPGSDIPQSEMCAQCDTIAAFTDEPNASDDVKCKKSEPTHVEKGLEMLRLNLFRIPGFKSTPLVKTTLEAMKFGRLIASRGAELGLVNLGMSLIAWEQSRLPDHSTQTRRYETMQLISEITEFETYGSIACGLDSNTSDIDIGCLRVLKGSKNGGQWTDAKMGGKALLRKLHNKLKMHHAQGHGRARSRPHNQRFQIHPILSARVPLLKVLDTKTRVEVDITVADSFNAQKTALMTAYCAIDGRVPVLIKLAKSWFQARGFGDASKGGFNSFGVGLLVICFLQLRGVLPCLQVPGVSCWKFQQTPRDGADRAFIQQPTRDDARLCLGNGEHIGTLLVAFLWFMSRLKPEKYVVSVRNGGFMPRADYSQFRQFSKSRPICIEDPFVPMENVARAMDSKLYSRRVRLDCYLAAQLAASQDILPTAETQSISFVDLCQLKLTSRQGVQGWRDFQGFYVHTYKTTPECWDHFAALGKAGFKQGDSIRGRKLGLHTDWTAVQLKSDSHNTL